MQLALLLIWHIYMLMGPVTHSQWDRFEHTQTCTPPVITNVTATSISTFEVQWLDFQQGAGILYAVEVVHPDSSQSGVPTIDSIDGLNVEISGLEHGTRYAVFMRAICPSGNSPWTQNPVYGTTWIDNGDGCGLELPIADNSCPAVQEYVVYVDLDTSMTLGVDVRLKQVELIVEHPWIADIRAQLVSPGGSVIALAAHRGGATENMGDPAAGTCNAPLIFADFACIAVREAELLRGFVRPDEALYELGDSTSAGGIWRIRLCDRAADDVGHLRQIRLVFDDQPCVEPPLLELGWESADSVVFHLGGVSGADSLFFTVGTGSADSIAWGDTLSHDTQFNQLTVGNLSPATNYYIRIRSQCQANFGPWSCVMSFATTCSSVAFVSDFNDGEDCVTLCGSTCPLTDSIWMNASGDSADWIRRSGETPTPGTGPRTDRTRYGQYLYVESSGAICDPAAPVILLSRCLSVVADTSACEMSMWYHMRGDSVGALAIEASDDNGMSWDAIWQVTGSQGDNWKTAFVDLDDLDGKVVLLRIITYDNGLALADVAIDDIVLTGVMPMTTTFYLDSDNDGFGDPQLSCTGCFNAAPPGHVDNEGDCDDENAMIYPGAQEQPCNLLDDNCDGQIDENQQEHDLRDTTITISHAACPGMNNGVIEIAANGGQPPYMFYWNTGDTTAVLTDLTSGEYQCTISDGAGCSVVTDTLFVENEVDFTASIGQAVQPSCLGLNDGSISLEVMGGTLPYAYMWNTGDTTANLNNIGSGMYSVTIQDSAGCFVEVPSIYLDAISLLTAEVVDRVDVSCFGANDGYIAVAVNSNQPGILYEWSNGDTLAEIDQLEAGYYSCTITDTTGCIVIIDSVEIQMPTQVQINIESAQPPGCNNESTGHIEVSVAGGNPPYDFLWNEGTASRSIENLPAGLYVLTVTDQSGCTSVTDSIYLPNPSPIVLEVDSITPAFCNTSRNGSIGVATTGGTPPYEYLWSNGIRNTPVINNIDTGFYRVTVTDAHGCKRVLSDGLYVGAYYESLPVSIETISPIICNGDANAALLAMIDTANTPVVFHWNTGRQETLYALSDTLQPLPGGYYSVTVTDALGCVGRSSSVHVPHPAPITFSAQVTDNTCFGTSDGAINVNLQGGVAPYMILWSNGDTTLSIDHLAPGYYSAIAWDANGCDFYISMIELDGADSVKIEFIVEEATGGMSNGTAEVSVQGGEPPFNYLWDANTGYQVTAKATGLSPGLYYVTVQDGIPCEYIDSVFVDQVNATGNLGDNELKVYPNPASQIVFIEGAKDVERIELIGSEGITYYPQIDVANENVTRIDLGLLPPGLYFISLDGLPTGLKLIVLP